MKAQAALFLAFLALWLARPARADNVDDAMAACIHKRDWSTEKCRYAPGSQALLGDYNESSVDLDEEPFFDALDATDSFGHALSKLGAEAADSCGRESSGDVKLAYVTQAIRDTRSRAHLTECLSACLVMCMASHLLTYQQSDLKYFESAEDAVASGTGQCTEFARVADRLADGAGLESSVALNISLRHAYVRVKLEGSWYYAEPQSDSCTFYTLDAP